MRQKEIVTVILAGGEGTRMGGLDKGLVLFKGRPLIEHVLARVIEQSRQSSTILVSANRHIQEYRKFGYCVFQDQLKRQGPLGGMLSALDYLPDTCERVQFVSCDTPFIPLDLIEKLSYSVMASYPYTDVKSHYCHAQYPISDLKCIEKLLCNTERRIRKFLELLDAEGILFQDEAAFTNYNTLSDL